MRRQTWRKFITALVSQHFSRDRGALQSRFLQSPRARREVSYPVASIAARTQARSPQVVKGLEGHQPGTCKRSGKGHEMHGQTAACCSACPAGCPLGRASSSSPAGQKASDVCAFVLACPFSVNILCSLPSSTACTASANCSPSLSSGLLPASRVSCQIPDVPLSLPAPSDTMPALPACFSRSLCCPCLVVFFCRMRVPPSQCPTSVLGKAQWRKRPVVKSGLPQFHGMQSMSKKCKKGRGENCSLYSVGRRRQHAAAKPRW